MAEKLTAYYQSLNIKTKYLHSDIKTIERTEILGDLRAGVFDVFDRHQSIERGLDLPEVSLVAVLDSDKEGFLRSERSLIQTIGRAARNIEGQVILYANQTTHSMKNAIEETERRRKIQKSHNDKHGIQPRSVKKVLRKGLAEIYGFESYLSEKNLKGFSSVKMQKKIKELKKQMRQAADNMNFEQAARLRDQIKGLEIKELEL